MANPVVLKISHLVAILLITACIVDPKYCSVLYVKYDLIPSLGKWLTNGISKIDRQHVAISIVMPIITCHITRFLPIIIICTSSVLFGGIYVWIDQIDLAEKGQTEPNSVLLSVHIAASSVAIASGLSLSRASARDPAARTLSGARISYLTSCGVGVLSGIALSSTLHRDGMSGALLSIFGAAWVALSCIIWRMMIEHRLRPGMTRQSMFGLLALILCATRLYLAMVLLARIDGVIAYRVIAWSCLIPNVVAFVVLVRRRLVDCRSISSVSARAV